MIKINEIFKVLNYFQCHTCEDTYITLEQLSEILNMKFKKIKLILDILQEACVFNIIEIEIEDNYYYYYQDSNFHVERIDSKTYSVFINNYEIGTIIRHKLCVAKYTYEYKYVLDGLERFFPALNIKYIEMYYNTIMDALDCQEMSERDD